MTPFEFEGEVRNRTTTKSISHVMRETDLMVHFSNQECMETTANDTILDYLFNQQNQRIAVCIRSLMDRVIMIS